MTTGNEKSSRAEHGEQGLDLVVDLVRGFHGLRDPLAEQGAIAEAQPLRRFFDGVFAHSQGQRDLCERQRRLRAGEDDAEVLEELSLARLVELVSQLIECAVEKQ